MDDRPGVAPLDRRDLACILALLAWGVAWLAPGLDHPRIWPWDEAFHQAATRGVYETFLYPHVLADPLYPVNLRQWWYSGVWLHKPPGAFWFGGLVMHLIGIRPMALRLAALVGELGAAALIYLVARPLAGRAPAVAAAAGFLVLPFGWTLVQGQFVGDVTDVTVTAWVTLSVAWIIWSIEKESWRWAAAAGAAMGVGYLCKSFLSLTPLGVLGVMWGLGRLKLCRGPKKEQVAAFVLAAAVVALPWNAYAARTWPDAYWRSFQHTLGFVSPESGEDVGSGARPRDAIFNELNETDYAPLSAAACLVVAVAIAVRAVRKREPTTVAISLWLWATWTAHSMVNVKGHGHLWHAVPAFFMALALLMRDAWRMPALAGAMAGAFFAKSLSEAVPFLGRIHEYVPAWFVQTHRAPGLAEGMVIAAAGAGLAAAGAGMAAKRGWADLTALGLGAVATGCWLWFFAWPAPKALLKNTDEWADDQRISYTREVGLALGAVLPEKSVLFMDKEMDPPHAFEWLNLIFWSGRMTEAKVPDPARALARGYHPYLVSTCAEPFKSVEPVPANAWMRAYDLLAPAEPPGLPPGAVPAAIQVGTQRVLGVAAGPLDRTHDRYAIFVHAEGMPAELPMAFVTEHGREEHMLSPELSLRPRQVLVGKAWFILPVVGPRRERVRTVDFGTGSVPLGPG